MIIGAAERIESAGRVRMQAELRWEQQDRHEMFWVDTEPEYADALSERSEGFLLAAYTLAALSGERRVTTGTVAFDPSVRGQLALWGRCLQEVCSEAGAPQLEVVFDEQACALPSESRCFGFISGGVDSLDMIHHNLALYPPGHPWRMDTAVLVYGLYGFDCRDGEVVPERLAAWRELHGRMQELLCGQDVGLITLRTNLRSLAGDFALWSESYMFYHLAVGHFLGPHFQAGWAAGAEIIPSSGWSAEVGLPQIGINDLLSLRVALRRLTRQEKLQALTDWPAALKVCQPCHWVRLPMPGEVNCGICEKCVRTRLVLLAAGQPETMPFSAPLTAGAIESIPLGRGPGKASVLRPLVRPLRQSGHPELAAALRRRLWRWTRRNGLRTFFSKTGQIVGE